MKIKFIGFMIVFSFIGFILAGCSSTSESDTTSADKDNGEQESSSEQAAYPNDDLLVDIEWVKENLDNENVRFVDMRGDDYEGGHIPGAVSATWQDVNDPNNPVEGFLLPADPFSSFIQELGINEDTTVVAYDAGNSMSAARLFYALEYYGKENVKILNGGFTAWLNAGEEVSTEAPTIEKGNFIAEAQKQLVSTKEEVESKIDKEDTVLLDVRSPEEYSGDDVRADRGGHIPNAINLEWTTAMTEKDGVPVFKSSEELANQFEETGVAQDKTIVPYCQTNARGAHTYFVLRLMGYDQVKPYEGSWAEWGNDPNTPIES
ncbi:sulfurtransferase [Aquibacillus sp. 3ASR75-11]|uniref:Sulfurtransferase n=1 Tax=Terrihalobacillus insolitus TaxID=2950438 RepID=A0A9X3WQS3_9BACI|nr:sulfurtransferase [Terrihalobacillus insolitus]MDC3414715.1 sulfurtransferase [Terrihalobacillus insolitus]MDC3424172.1 sulfurtransferase [Terrihalobacillus insolitus]